jgi:thiol-disulfide isomerase/thioredoxin
MRHAKSLQTRIRYFCPNCAAKLPLIGLAAGLALLSPIPVYAELSGKVQNVGGQPVAGAVVTLLVGGANKSVIYASLHGTELSDTSGRSVSTKTDNAGTFQIPTPQPDAFLVVTGPAGFAAVPASQLGSNPVVTVSAWAQVDGVWINKGQPMKSKLMGIGLAGDVRRWLWVDDFVQTDSNGRFAFAVVPPMRVSILWQAPVSQAKPLPANNLKVAEADLAPGQKTQLKIATDGREVIGRIVSGPNTDDVSGLRDWNISLVPDAPRPPKPPKELVAPEAIAKWTNEWDKSPAGEWYREAQFNIRQAAVASNGGFQVEAVAPGPYVLRGFVFGPSGLIARVRGAKIEVPAGDSPYSIGDIQYEATNNLKIGAAAPPFTVPTLDGGTVSLSEFGGKYVLLDFWATWCGACVAEMPNLRQIHDAYGSDPRFAMVGLSLDNDRSAAQRFADQKGTNTWRQGFLGEWSKDPVHAAYAVYGIPEIMLVGPDGRILATHLCGEQIKAVIAKVLGH